MSDDSSSAASEMQPFRSASLSRLCRSPLRVHTLKKTSKSEPLWHRLHNIEVKTAWILVCLRPSELLVIHVSIKSCAYKEGVRRGRFDCTTLEKKHELLWQQTQTFNTTSWNWFDKDTASRVFSERYRKYEANLLYFSSKIAVKTSSCTLALLLNKKRHQFYSNGVLGISLK